MVVITIVNAVGSGGFYVGFRAFINDGISCASSNDIVMVLLK